MSDQLAFDLSHRPALGREDFFVSTANGAAMAGIDAWADWHRGKAVLIGPEAAGKTHLAHVWAASTGAAICAAADLPDRVEALSRSAPAMVVEDADRIAGHGVAEEALFHLHNALAGRGAALLITGREPPGLWGVRLPDLASRLAQATLLRLDPPDDALLAAVMLKLAHDRNLAVRPATLHYIATRIDRSFAAAAGIIAALDAEAIAQQRAPTRDLARIVLEQAERSACHGDDMRGA